MSVESDVREVAGRGRRPRGSLTVDQIVDVALEIAQLEGLDALSMPKLARRLGCGVMTIYGYVEGRDELLSLLCSRILRDFPFDRASVTDGRSALTGFACALRERMLQFPALATLLAQRKMWSDEVAELLEWLLGVLVSDGWELHDAIRAYRTVQTFTLGFVVYEVPRTADGGAGHENWWRHTLADLPEDSYPLLHAAAPHLPEGPRPEQFAWSLNAILNGLTP